MCVTPRFHRSLVAVPLKERLGAAPFEDRILHFHSPEIQEIWREAGETVRRKIAEYQG